MHIHCAGLAGKVVVPHRLEDIVPREYHAAPRGQEAQQFKLLIRKFHQGAVFPHLSGGRIDLQVAAGDDRLAPGPAGAAEQALTLA